MNSSKPNLSRRDKALKDLIRIIRPIEIVEVGSWEGRSCIGFLEIADELGIQTKILCVDTWLGSHEHWFNKLPNSEWGFDSLKVVEGEPQILETFRSNVRDSGFENQVSILRCPSEFTGKYLRENHFQAELIYVDACHEFHAVKRDLEIAKSSFNNINISGDDFIWPSVRRAISSFARKNKFRIYVAPDQTTWIVLPRGEKNISVEFEKNEWKKKNTLKVYVSETANSYLNSLKHYVKKNIIKL
jgi:hypothetical protein